MNMWILLSLLAFVKAETDVRCDRNYVFYQCPRPTLFNMIPKELEVFNALCPEISTYLECTEEFQLNCGKTIKEYKKNEEFFEELCTNGTQSNGVVVSDLQCVNETLTNMNCWNEKDSFITSNSETESVDEFRTRNFTSKKVICVAEILLAHCILDDVAEQCGSLAGHYTIEYIRNTPRIVSSCPMFTVENLIASNMDGFGFNRFEKAMVRAELRRIVNAGLHLTD